MATIKFDKVVIDNSIYPREKWNTNTVKIYADALKGGAKFPPIILEEGTNRLIDGLHRLRAHQQYLQEYQEYQAQLTLEGIERDGWEPASDVIEVEYCTIPEGIPPKLYAASFSTRHGDKIPTAERKAIARGVYEENPDFTLAVLKQYLDVSIGSAHGYVEDILARRKEQKRMIAFRLNLLGWTEREIAEVIGVSPSNAHEICSDFSDLKNQSKKLIAEGHPHLDIAERFNMPLILVWAIDLQGRTDAQRMERLGVKVQPYDVWNFSKCGDLFGFQHPGRIPGELVAHVLYFFTESGAKVIDPMAGGGTTLDVCLALGRECYAYDIDERHNRPDIIRHDLTKPNEDKQFWPDRIKKADLIFWDPPYFEKMDKKSIGEEGYIEGSISALGREAYLSFFWNRLTEAKKLVKKGTRLAFLMSDWDDDTGEREGIFLWDYANLIQRADWELIRHVQVPLSTQQVHPDIVNKFRKSRRLARLERYLLIAEA